MAGVVDGSQIEQLSNHLEFKEITILNALETDTIKLEEMKEQSYQNVQIERNVNEVEDIKNFTNALTNPLIIEKIFHHLGFKELKVMRHVCTLWNYEATFQLRTRDLTVTKQTLDARNFSLYFKLISSFTVDPIFAPITINLDEYQNDEFQNILDLYSNSIPNYKVILYVDIGYKNMTNIFALSNFLSSSISEHLDTLNLSLSTPIGPDPIEFTTRFGFPYLKHIYFTNTFESANFINLAANVFLRSPNLRTVEFFEVACLAKLWGKLIGNDDVPHHSRIPQWTKNKSKALRSSLFKKLKIFVWAFDGLSQGVISKLTMQHLPIKELFTTIKSYEVWSEMEVKYEDFLSTLEDSLERLTICPTVTTRFKFPFLPRLKELYVEQLNFPIAAIKPEKLPSLKCLKLGHPFKALEYNLLNENNHEDSLDCYGIEEHLTSDGNSNSQFSTAPKMNSAIEKITGKEISQQVRFGSLNPHFGVKYMEILLNEKFHREKRISWLFTHFPALHVISLSGHTMSGKTFTYFCKQLPRCLETIEIQWDARVEDKIIYKLSEKELGVPLENHLHFSIGQFSENYEIWTNGFVGNLPCLKKLEIHGKGGTLKGHVFQSFQRSWILEAGIYSLRNTLTNLRLPYIPGIILEEIGKNLPRLLDLKLTGDKCLCSIAKSAIREMLPKCQITYLTCFCPKDLLEDEFFSYLDNFCPNNVDS